MTSTAVVSPGQPSAEALPPAGVLAFLRWVVPLIAGRGGVLARVALLSCVASLLVLAQPWLAMVLVDDGALAGNLHTLVVACTLMLLMPLLGLVVEAVTRFDYLALSSHVLFALRERIFAHLQRRSPAFYAQVGYGDLLARFDGDLAEVQRFAVDGPLAVLNGAFNLLALGVLLTLLSPTLALLVLAMVPLQLLLTLGQGGRMEATTADVRREATRLSAYFLDSLRALKLIQSSNGEGARLDGLRRRHTDYYVALRAAQQAGFALTAWQRLAGLCGTALVFGVGGYLVATRQISVGVLLGFVIYAARAAAPVQTLLGVIAGWQRARVSVARLAELLDAPVGAGRPDAPVGPAPPRLAADDAPGRTPEGDRSTAGGPLADRVVSVPVRGALTLIGVHFIHRDGRVVLCDASLHIDAGRKVIIVGASGGGKSTLADLLLGHLQPTAGTLSLDGVPLSAIPLAELRRRIAVVDQEPAFLPGTVADNMRVVAPGASDETLVAALRDAGLAAHELGLDTSVGAAVAALSRGQRLRLALARALLQRPAVLVLDETTSAVDRDMEQQLLATIDRRFVDCTRLILTHHPQAAAGADATWRLQDGCFVALPAPEDAHAL